jgi:hypothetical protein
LQKYWRFLFKQLPVFAENLAKILAFSVQTIASFCKKFAKILAFSVQTTASFCKKFAKILAFSVQTTASLCKNLILTWVFEKSANLCAEIWRKSPKIVIITSTLVCTNLSTLNTYDGHATGSLT